MWRKATCLTKPESESRLLKVCLIGLPCPSNSCLHFSPLTPWGFRWQSSYSLSHLLKDENSEQGNFLWSLACISIIFCSHSLEFGFKILDSSMCPLMPGSRFKIICSVQLSELLPIGKMFSVFWTVIPDWSFTHSCWVIRDNSATWLIYVTVQGKQMDIEEFYSLTPMVYSAPKIMS